MTFRQAQQLILSHQELRDVLIIAAKLRNMQKLLLYILRQVVLPSK